MLIEIGRDIVQVAADENDPLHEDALELLGDLAYASRKGYHLITAGFQTLNAIIELSNLDEKTRRTYCYIKSRLSTSNTLYQSIGKRILLSCCLTEPIDSTRIMMNPFNYSKFEWNHETHILAENLQDIDFFEFLFKSYLRRKQIKVRSVYYPLQGGGDPTSDVYSREVLGRRNFCLAILDSDKKYPNCQIGDTAKKVKRVENRNSTCSHCKHYILNVREIENLIPLYVIQGMTNYQNNQVIKDELVFDMTYFDMKYGLMGNKLVNEIYEHYEGQFRNKSDIHDKMQKCMNCVLSRDSQEKKDCNKECNGALIIQGFGSKFLEVVLKDANSKTELENMTDEKLTETQLVDWDAIGKLFLQWTCASDPCRV